MNFNTIKLTDTHLAVINKALEVYYRMKSGQISYALDNAYDFKMNHDQTSQIEKLIKSFIFPDLKSSGSGYGFRSPELGDGSIAFEIKKTFEEYLAVKNNDGYYGNTVDFNGPLKASDEPLPLIVDFKPYKDFHLNKRQSSKIQKLINKKDYQKVWEYIDSLGLNLPNGEKKEIICFGDDFAHIDDETAEYLSIRVWKPRKK
jgi:hypothetical protein